MPRTTIGLDQSLIEELKHLAAENRESMSRITNRLLRRALEAERAARRTRRPAPRWHVVTGGVPAPGFDPSSRDYLDLLRDGP